MKRFFSALAGIVSIATFASFAFVNHVQAMPAMEHHADHSIQHRSSQAGPSCVTLCTSAVVKKTEKENIQRPAEDDEDNTPQPWQQSELVATSSLHEPSRHALKSHLRPPPKVPLFIQHVAQLE